MKNFLLNTQLISKFRSELMGLATIGILMCHAHAYDVSLPFHLDSVLGLGQMGVMLFFFLSGIGLSYSLGNVEFSCKSTLKWYRKRFTRLLIPYLIITGSAILVEMIGNQIFSGGGYLYRLSTVSYWFHDGGAWFVCVLIPLYLIAPFWKVVLGKVKFPIIPTLLIMGIMYFANTSFQGDFRQAAFFFPGFWMARYIKSNYQLSLRGTILFFLCIGILLVLYRFFGVGALLAILLFPFIWISCLLLNLMENTFVNPVLRFFGNISLESYLFNTSLITWINHFNLLPGSLYPYRYAFIVVFGVLFAWIIHTACKPLVKIIGGK